jgi:hypothetical protein
MKSYFSSKAFLAIFIIALLTTCNQVKDKEVLFNGVDLIGWDAYVAPASDSSAPLGINQDPNHIFSVVQLDGAPAIRVSGEGYAGLSTTREFRNYHLTLEFKWGVAKIPSFQNRKRDSGVLYHANGPHGVDARAWMQSQEFQIQEGDCGDYWGVAGGIFDIPATKNQQGEYVYDSKGSLLTFQDKTEIGRRCIKMPDNEKPTSEWNKVELYCFGDSSIHIMNGVVVMRLYHSQQSDNGILTSLKGGKIQLQSEGCEVYYRSLTVEPIGRIPEALSNL